MSLGKKQIFWEGMILHINITGWWPARAAPFAQTPDSSGYADEGDRGEVEGDIEGIEIEGSTVAGEETPGIYLDGDHLRLLDDAGVLSLDKLAESISHLMYAAAEDEEPDEPDPEDEEDFWR